MKINSDKSVNNSVPGGTMDHRAHKKRHTHLKEKVTREKIYTLYKKSQDLARRGPELEPKLHRCRSTGGPVHPFHTKLNNTDSCSKVYL